MVGRDTAREPHDEFESFRVLVDGLSMSAVRSGRGDGVPLILVHGLGLSHRYMMPVARELARDLAVYVPDLPGFGDSEHPPKILDVAGLANALAHWMRVTGLERADLLGNSFGCQIIVELAARHPRLVRRAVLQGPTTPPEERTWLWQAIRWRQNENPKEMGRIALRDYRRAGYLRTLVTFQRSLQHRVEDVLPLVQAPTLVVRGSEDPICRPRWAEEVARALPRGSLAILPGFMHTLCFTAPIPLARVTRAFVASAAVPAGVAT